ncbi:MAG: multifunctional CCA addition/repair protein [Gammaproteobacteria bacterium]|nr:multifunctional CCA addition/repair protein [Gammaproteobacteria bacterium]
MKENKGLAVYLVGGAVRDRLLGRPVGERDWVVVGARAEDLVNQGFKPVGKDFPVFLHPQTHEEYALARTERKTAPGYKGFLVHASPDVSLQEDLLRRDLTINAIAETPEGEIIDPLNGQADLAARCLRHVSPAFVEDPVRILRVARFAARFAPLGFHVAPETMALMQSMVASGEVDALVAERVWAETFKALQESTPSHFFSVLRACGALARLFPEIDALFGVPQPPQYHPEVDTGVHTLLVLDQAAQRSDDSMVRFAALLHDLGKATTPPEHWPKHHGHEQRTAPLVRRLCKRLRVPNQYADLAEKVGRWHGVIHKALELRPATLLGMFNRLDVWRRPERLAQILLACRADAAGRPGFEDRPYPQADYVAAAFAACAQFSGSAWAQQGLKGTQIAQALGKQRLEALKEFKAQYCLLKAT